MKRFCTCCLLFCVVQAQDKTHTLISHGVERSYILYVPSSYTAGTPLPLLLVLHGKGGSAEGVAEMTGFSGLAEEQNFIALYPNGLEQQWNFVKDPPGYTRMRQDDVGFLLELVDEITRQYAVDDRRIYVTGFSNGGFMTQRLACSAPERFAAFASVGGAGFGGLDALCQTPSALSLMLMHGTKDTVVPWSGHTRRRLESVTETFAFWSIYTGCNGDLTETSLPQMTIITSVTLIVAGCPDGNELLLYKIEGGGHNWPGAEGFLSSEVAGNVTMDIQASEVIWEFFSRHSRADDR